LFVLGGSFTVVNLAHVTLAAPPKAGAKDAKAKQEVLPKWPEAPKLTIVTKSSDPQELSQLTEMVSTINKLTEAKWKENKIVPSRYADDFEFIRRASLDLIGRIAKPEEIRAFLKDSKETRRSKLIDRLLESDEYPHHWSNLWANWLLSRAGVFGRGTYHEYLATWLEEQSSQNKP